MGIKLREKTLSDGRRSLYLDIYHQGRRSYEFLELYYTKDRNQNRETKALAMNILAKRQLDTKSQEHEFTPAFKKKTDFLTYFETASQAKTKSEALRGGHNYESALRHLKAYSKGPVQMGALNEKWLEGFKSYLLDTGIRANTANHYISKTKAILRQAHNEGYLSSDFYHNVKQFPDPETEKVFLTPGEVKTLAETPCRYPEVKRAFFFGCNTGLRHSDIKALTWGNIKTDKIHFQQKKTWGFEYLPLNPTALAILRQQKGDTLPLPSAPVFNIPDRQHISRYLKDWFKESKIKKHITFHSSRHTFATSLLTEGNDLYTVSKLLGHKDIKTTAVYAKVVDEKKQEAVNSLPIVEVLK